MAAAVAVASSSVPLRIQYARMLLQHQMPVEALEQASAALQLDPASADALALVNEAATTLTSGDVPTAGGDEPSQGEQDGDGGSAGEPDWERLEGELGITVPPPFVRSDTGAGVAGEGLDPLLVPADGEEGDASDLFDVSRVTVRLDDVGGLDHVKARIREAFLEPMRNEAIAKAFGKSLRGGLMLYGPPGTGKTFLARAVAGELGAKFLSVTLADILDKWIGVSESNLHELFQEARRLAPAVLFLDEIDALGGKRSSATSGMRTVVNQLLQEMDGIGSDNDGLFVLAATNHPWDVDSALMRPGRFDRVVLVLPPDGAAREAILRNNLAGRPISGIDLGWLVKHTDNFSGADLSHLCSTAAEKAMAASIRHGEILPIEMDHLKAALKEVRPSTTAWLHSARNVVTFANKDGMYDELEAYLKARKIL